jgi:hypothetical protein
VTALSIFPIGTVLKRIFALDRCIFIFIVFFLLLLVFLILSSILSCPSLRPWRWCRGRTCTVLFVLVVIVLFVLVVIVLVSLVVIVLVSLVRTGDRCKIPWFLSLVPHSRTTVVDIPSTFTAASIRFILPVIATRILVSCTVGWCSTATATTAATTSR